LFAPATGRNRDPILAVLRRVLGSGGRVLEVASGTGEHVAHFAAALPEVTFQPSEPDPRRRASIDAWTAGLANVRPAMELDAAGDWAVAAVDAVLCINMIHIAPWAACEGLVRGAGRVVGRGGCLVLYGPFRRGGAHTAASNAAFDEGLRAQDARWGVRDLEDVASLAAAAGFGAPEVVEMPANNLTVIWRRGG
jgi:SAM-dependent methyltransferase